MCALGKQTGQHSVVTNIVNKTKETHKKNSCSFLMRSSLVLGVSVVLLIFGYSSCATLGNNIDDDMEAEKWEAYKVCTKL